MSHRPNMRTTHLDAYDEEIIDFSNAVLYVGALQTILATGAASLVSVLSCWLLPVAAISAVRTLVLSSITACLLVRKPFRLGHVHGLGVIFNALRPCVAIYIVSMVLEQLVHTCTRDSVSPSWRRIVFHFSITLAMLSGFSRARRPLEETDAPFLATGFALFVIAMLPPPAVLLAGPLCAEPTLGSSAERIVRSLMFSFLYCIFVYASAPPVHSSGEVLVCVMRASSASLWTLGCHVVLLPLAIVQAAVVVYVRIYTFEYSDINNTKREHIRVTTPLVSGSTHQSPDIEQVPARPVSSDQSKECISANETNGVMRFETQTDTINPMFGSFGARSPVDISCFGDAHNVQSVAGSPATATGQQAMSKERMAEIAAQM